MQYIGRAEERLSETKGTSERKGLLASKKFWATMPLDKLEIHFRTFLLRSYIPRLFLE